MTKTNISKKCQYCGQPPHPGVCPTVKAIEYFEDGSVKRVEFKTAADYALPIAYSAQSYSSSWPSMTC